MPGKSLLTTLPQDMPTATVRSAPRARAGETGLQGVKRLRPLVARGHDILRERLEPGGAVEDHRGRMTTQMLLAVALLFGFASFTSAHAEWEILDRGSAVYAGATTAPAMETAQSSTPTTTASGTSEDFAKNHTTSK
jgi:hypothetical protein